MRKLILLMVAVFFVISWSSPVEAKAIVERLVITSPVLAEDIIVDDERWVSLLGTYNIRDPQLKLDEPPADIDVPYEVERQFAGEDHYTTLDSFEYYPGTAKQHGYIHFRWHLGSRNDRSDDFEGDWYLAHPEAELALNHILNSQHLNNYLIAYGGEGNILLLDPQSLDIQYTLGTKQESWIDILQDSATLDGTRLFFQTNTGRALQQNVLDLTLLEVCSLETSAVVMPTLDGKHLLFQVENMLQVRDAQTYELVDTIDLNSINSIPDTSRLEEFGGLWDDETQQLEFIQLDTLSFGVPDTLEIAELKHAGAVIETIGTHQWRYYFYPRLGTTTDEVDGGIFSTTNNPDAQYERFQPDLDFQQVIMAGNSLYALEAPAGDEVSTIYRLDINTGEILNLAEVSPDIHYLGFEALDTATLAADSVISGECNITLP